MASMLLIEPHWEGHHLRYLRWIATEAVSRGYEVYLATSAATQKQPLFLALQEECGGRMRTVTLPINGAKPDVRDTAGLVRLEFRYRSMFAECYRRLAEKQRPDYVLMPYLDYCAYAIALLGSPFGSSPWSGLITRPSFHLGKEGVRVPGSRLRWIKERLFVRLLQNRTLRTLFTFDELLVQHARQRWPSLSMRLRFLPEPAELYGSSTREEARRALGIPSDATVVLVYGSLDYSKGIDALLAATAEEQFPGEVSLLLAGRQDAEVKTLLAAPHAESLRRAGRLYEIDKFLYGEEEHSVFRAADIAWLGYREQYISSGVLLQAAMAGLPLVACDEGLICWQTRKHELGLVVPIQDVRAVAGAIYRLAHEQELVAEFERNARYFSVLHTVDHFTRAVGEELLRNFPPARP